MTYYGDYGFDAFLETGASNDQEMESIVLKNLLAKLPSDKSGDVFGCSSFLAQTPSGEYIFGRNWDYHPAPALLLFTNPPNGYASMAMSDLSFLGYTNEALMSGGLMERFRLLAAPYVPIDGINEMGLGASFLAVPHAEPPYDPSKPSINTTAMIRLLLDHASSVSEAVRFFEQYNIYFSHNVPVHFMVTDSTGEAAVIEFVDEKIHITRTNKVTNFTLHNAQPLSSHDPRYVYEGFDRYDKISQSLQSSDNILTSGQGIKLLEDILIPASHNRSRTLWSALYNLEELSLEVAVGQNYSKLYQFVLH